MTHDAVPAVDGGEGAPEREQAQAERGAGADGPRRPQSTPPLTGEGSDTLTTVTSGALNVPRPSAASRASGERRS